MSTITLFTNWLRGGCVYDDDGQILQIGLVIPEIIIGAIIVDLNNERTKCPLENDDAYNEANK